LPPLPDKAIATVSNGTTQKSPDPSSAESHRLGLPDIFARFQRWAVSEPKDIGLQTEAVLTDGTPWDLAAGIESNGMRSELANTGFTT